MEKVTGGSNLYFEENFLIFFKKTLKKSPSIDFRDIRGDTTYMR